MKVEYVGMCGSDIHGFEFGPFIPPKDPNQKIGLGHEVAGEVVGIGSKVTKFKVGDKVLIEPGVPDDTCEYCRTGRYNICPGVDFMATQPNYKGALTQYMTHPEEWTYHIPEGMSTLEGALVEPEELDACWNSWRCDGRKEYRDSWRRYNRTDGSSGIKALALRISQW